MTGEAAAVAANHDPLALALVAIVIVSQALLMLLRRSNSKHVPGPPAGFTAEEAGQVKEKIATLEREVNGFRDWRHDDYVKDMTKLATQFVPRNEIMLMHKESSDDRERIWSAVEHIRRELQDRR